MRVDQSRWPLLIDAALALREKFLSNRKTCESGCIEWTAGRDRDGYGKFKVRIVAEGKPIVWGVFAHRLALAFDGVEVPDELLVRHRCDNPPCVNPEHLSLGTDKDNKRDALSRRRACVGERHPFARLTDGIVNEIIRRRNSGETHASIAASLGVSAGSVSMVGRVSWRHLRADDSAEGGVA